MKSKALNLIPPQQGKNTDDSDGSTIVKIACGYAHSISLTDKGQVFGHGYSYYGELGMDKTYQENNLAKLDICKSAAIASKGMGLEIADVYCGNFSTLFVVKSSYLPHHRQQSASAAVAAFNGLGALCAGDLYFCGLNTFNRNEFVNQNAGPSNYSRPTLVTWDSKATKSKLQASLDKGQAALGHIGMFNDNIRFAISTRKENGGAAMETKLYTITGELKIVETKTLFSLSEQLNAEIARMRLEDEYQLAVLMGASSDMYCTVQVARSNKIEAFRQKMHKQVLDGHSVDVIVTFK